MADVYRAGGIDADELDHNLTAGADIRRAKGIAGGADGLNLLLQPGLAELEIDETRRRGSHALDFGGTLDSLRDELGQLERVGAGGTGEAQGQVGGEVAVLGVVGPLDLDVGHGIDADCAIPIRPFQGRGHRVGNGVSD